MRRGKIARIASKLSWQAAYLILVILVLSIAVAVGRVRLPRCRFLLPRCLMSARPFFAAPVQRKNEGGVCETRTFPRKNINVRRDLYTGCRWTASAVMGCTSTCWFSLSLSWPSPDVVLGHGLLDMTKTSLSVAELPLL